MEKEALKKREKIQKYFWNIVGSAEHINLPKLEDALKKEFNTTDDRIIQASNQVDANRAKNKNTEQCESVDKTTK